MSYQCLLITEGVEMPLKDLCTENLKECCENQVKEYLETVQQDKMEMKEWTQESKSVPDVYLKIVPANVESKVYAYDFVFS